MRPPRTCSCSPRGRPGLRALARRVVLAAPEADETWSYVDARPPVRRSRGGRAQPRGLTDVALAEVRVAARMDEGRFDVQVHHPPSPTSPSEARAQVTFLALDATLGEVDTELWLGEVQPVGVPAAGRVRADGAAVRRQRPEAAATRRRRPAALGDAARRDRAQGPLRRDGALAAAPGDARRTSTPTSRWPCPIAPDSTACPATRRSSRCATFEHRLGARGSATSGQVVAHLSTAVVRTLHLYVDSSADVLPTVKEVARSWDQGRATVHEMHDPAWQAVAHLRQ